MDVYVPTGSTGYTVKRPRHILRTKVKIPLGPGLNLHGHFQQQYVTDKIHEIYYGCLHCLPYVTCQYSMVSKLSRK